MWQYWESDPFRIRKGSLVGQCPLDVGDGRRDGVRMRPASGSISGPRRTARVDNFATATGLPARRRVGAPSIPLPGGRRYSAAPAGMNFPEVRSVKTLDVVGRRMTFRDPLHVSFAIPVS